MAICLKDGEVFKQEINNLKREDLLMFFMSGHQESLITVYDEYDKYLGVISYYSLLFTRSVKDALITEKVRLNQNVWSDAAGVLNRYPLLGKVPVLADDDSILYLAVNDLLQAQRLMRLCYLIQDDTVWEDVSSVQIDGINEVLFWLKKFLERKGIPVAVSGDGWAELGESSESAELKHPQYVGEDGNWIDELYVRRRKERSRTGSEGYWESFCEHAGQENTKVVFCGRPNTLSEKLYDNLLQEDIYPQTVFCLDGYRTLFGLQTNMPPNTTNIIYCFADNGADIHMSIMFEMIFRRQGGWCDNLYLLSETGRYMPDTGLRSMISHCGKVVVMGDGRLSDLFQSVYAESGAEIIYAEKEECVTGYAGKYRDALWFYLDFPLKNKESEFEKAAAACKKNGIYLSRYFMDHYRIYENEPDRSEYDQDEADVLTSLGVLQGIADQCGMESKPSEKQKILFLGAQFSYMWEAIEPLFKYYMQRGDTECTVMFYSVEQIAWVGVRNLREFVDNVSEIQALGGRVYLYHDQFLDAKYDVCYICLGYSHWYHHGIGADLRSACKMFVSLQTTAYHTHYYIGDQGFAAMFHENHRKGIDYAVVSDFMAEWAKKRDQKWENKLLPLGYPRMDRLYEDLHDANLISKDWESVIKDKKVIYFTAYAVELFTYCLPYCEDDRCVLIWRPHPYDFDSPRSRERIREWGSRKNVLIDTNKSYSMAFRYSDALVTTYFSSVLVNYLFTDKPILILDKGYLDKHKNQVDYQEEAWYKASYIANDEKAANDFIDMIIAGKDERKVETMPYRQYMQRGFDGKVCERIASFIEDNLK